MKLWRLYQRASLHLPCLCRSRVCCLVALARRLDTQRWQVHL